MRGSRISNPTIMAATAAVLVGLVAPVLAVRAADLDQPSAPGQPIVLFSLELASADTLHPYAQPGRHRSSQTAGYRGAAHPARRQTLDPAGPIGHQAGTAAGAAPGPVARNRSAAAGVVTRRAGRRREPRRTEGAVRLTA